MGAAHPALVDGGRRLQTGMAAVLSPLIVETKLGT